MRADAAERCEAAGAHAELVLRVEREVVGGRMPPRVPRGRPSMCRLPQTRAARVLGERGRHRAVADRPAADLHRGRDVALDERGRHAEHFGDVVEALARVVGRQQRRDVDLRRAGRERRWRTRRDSAGAAPGRRRSVRDAARSSPARIARRSHRARRDGRGLPAGGIIPVRSLRTAFSQTSASSPRRLKSRCSSDRPPADSASSWQLTQLRSSRANCGSAHDGVSSRFRGRSHGRASTTSATTATTVNLEWRITNPAPCGSIAGLPPGRAAPRACPSRVLRPRSTTRSPSVARESAASYRPSA